MYFKNNLVNCRLITACTIILITIFALFFLSPVSFSIITLIICMLSSWEWSKLVNISINCRRIWLTIMLGLFLISTIFTSMYKNHLTVLIQVKLVLWISFIFWTTTALLVLYYPFSIKFLRNSYFLRLMYGTLIILPFFLGMITLRQYHYELNKYIGAWWLLYVMLIVWAVDSGSYFFGTLLGRNKLSLNISPHKTWEGFWGGMITSAITAWIFIQYAPINARNIPLIISSIITALVSVLGDLTESIFKREAGVKDSGNLIPGHGGILDRIDSLMAAVPIFLYFMILIFNAI